MRPGAAAGLCVGPAAEANPMPDTAPPLRNELEAANSDSASDSGTIAIDRPPEARTIFLGGLMALAALAACYVAAEIVLPIVLGFVLNLVFQPVLRVLRRIGLPRTLAALVIVLVLVALFVGIGLLLSGPLTGWISKLPQTLPRIQERLSFLNGPAKSMQRALEHIQNLAPGGDGGGSTGAARPVAVQGASLPQQVLSQVRIVAAGAFETLLVMFFALVSGETFLRRLVEVLPRFEDKKRAVDISQQIERDISVYLGTITVMNTLVGVAAGTMAWLVGLGDPLLWGTFAFLLNYVPILGPTAGVIIFFVAGLVTIDPLWAAFVPAVLYLMIHVAEGETITPMLLAARFTVNPVLVMVGVIFWYWIWGVCGAILATPMLAIVKIVCDRIDRLKPIGHFIGG
jgi:predicted PurR-regulated permease PerM